MLKIDTKADLVRQLRARLFEIAPEFDAVVTTNTIHVGYLGGYRSILHDADRYYRSALVATRDITLLVTGASDAAAALEVFHDPSRIFRYGTFYVSAHQPGTGYAGMPPAAETFEGALDAAIKSLIKTGMRIGIDAPDIAGLSAIQNMLVGYATANATPSFTKARSVKLPSEIEKLRFASIVAEEGMQKAFSAAFVGMTELELSTIISSTIIASGGIPRFIVVTAGERSALVDAYATKRPLAAGDLLRIDVGCTFDGYWADNARTAVIGTPTKLQQSRYDAIRVGEQAQLDAIRPGLTAAELYRIGVDVTRDAGFPDFNRNHCGHGIGVVAHEYPSLNAANNEVPLRAGMTLCVETPYYETGWGGMMVEDTGVVTSKGFEAFTVADRSLKIIQA